LIDCKAIVDYGRRLVRTGMRGDKTFWLRPDVARRAGATR